MPIVMYWPTPPSRELWNRVSEEARQAADQISGLYEAGKTKAGELKDAAIDQAGQLRDYAVDKAREARDYAVNKAEQLRDAVVDTAQAAKEKAQALAEQAARAAAAAVERAKQGIKQAFEAGKQLAADLHCKAATALFNPRYLAYNKKQVRICSDAQGNQTIEEVQRGPNGKYYATGQVTTPVGDVWGVKPYDTPKPIQDPNFPKLTHVNGIDVTPASGLQDARMLQDGIRNGCSELKGGGAGGGGAGGPCEACGDCILYTYSANTGMVGDLGQCLDAKAGWNGAITQSQAETMRDAIENNKHVTVSAHSRGSILTDNSWKMVFEEYTNRYRSDAYNSPEAIAAANQARNLAMAGPLGSPLTAGAAAEIARRAAAQEIAEQRAAAKINEHVTVVNSGNAVWWPNDRQQGDRVVTSWNGIPTDLVTVFTGATKWGNLPMGSPGGWMYGATQESLWHGSGMNTVWVDINDNKQVADARARAVEAALNPDDPSKARNASADGFVHHTYGHWYVGKVAEQYCNRSKQRAGAGG